MMIQRNGARGTRPVRTRRVMADTDVATEAVDLLFEAEDVAELVAEVTGEDVEVTADDNAVTFDVGDASYTVEAEGTEESVESSVRISKTRRPVSASTRARTRTSAGRSVRRVKRAR